MHIAKEEIPVKIDVPGALARHLPDFGEADGVLAAEFFTLQAGTDIAPLLVGLSGGVCDAPHWGYMITGELVVTYSDGETERCAGGEVFHWPAGHTVRVERDAELILFSPRDEHGAVMDHMLRRLAAV